MMWSVMQVTRQRWWESRGGQQKEPLQSITTSSLMPCGISKAEYQGLFSALLASCFANYKACMHVSSVYMQCELYICQLGMPRYLKSMIVLR